MLNSHPSSKGETILALTRLTISPSTERQELDLRQRSILSDYVDALVEQDAQADKTEYQSWDLGAVQLEQVLVSDKAKMPGGSRACLPASECIVYVQHLGPDALAHPQRGSPSDLRLRIVVKSCHEGADEQILTWHLPRALFQKSAFFPNAECIRVLNFWQGSLLANYSLSLANELPSISRERWSDMGAATCTVVRACLASDSDNAAATEKPTVTALRTRVGRVVRQQMNSPKLTPRTLAQLVAMSRSKLYRLFESSGGVARFIQQERLHEARRRLADTGVWGKTTISTLAIEIGFHDHSSFSRAFKLKYGCSPSEYREMISSNRLLEGSGDSPRQVILV
jgi:AraC-like DNA-binding protein